MMNQTETIRRSRQRGYSLIEILVAMTIFTTVVLAALLLYDRSNKVFKQSVESSDMQQSTRVAFDKLVADLRMTGFDFDRDGSPFGALAAVWSPKTSYTAGMLVQPVNANGHTYLCVQGGVSSDAEPVWPEGKNLQVVDGGVKWQENGTLQFQQPDEQIEYAGSHAVAIRANFNYQTAAGQCTAKTPCENGREPALESTPFPVVTTANNEIVIYALKPVKWAKGETADDLVLYADVAIPREVNPATDKDEKKITISGVDLCDKGCNSPPYTLYRYTITDKGEPDAGMPVADNIRSMAFRYFTTTTAGTADQITTLPNGEGMYSGAKPDAIVAERDARASIRALEIALTGMNTVPDKDYTDPTDAVAPHYRKLALTSLVVPRNIGRRGMKELSSAEPGDPEIQSVCTGACNAAFLTWTPPASGGSVDSYAVLYGTTKCDGTEVPASGFQFSEEVGLNLSGSVGRYTTPGQEYYFAVQAINKWGQGVSPCVGPYLVQNMTKPAALTELHASGGNEAAYVTQKNRIDLWFPPATKNDPANDELSCGTGKLEQQEVPPAEKHYYEVYRGTTPNFQPGATGTVRVLDAGTAAQPVLDGTLLKWSDKTAGNCTTYYYRVRVVDYCARKDTWNSPKDTAQATSEWYPATTANAIQGRAENTAAKPLAPTLILEKSVCAGASSNCTLTFSWNSVTKNTAAETIAVDEYTLRGYKHDGTKFGTSPAMTKPVNGGVLTTTYSVGAADLWKFTLVASAPAPCLVSDESAPTIFPCLWTSGTVSLQLASGSAFGGSGTSGDPYIVEGPSVVAGSTLPVASMRIQVFDTVTGEEIGTGTTVTGPVQTATVALPQTVDGHTSRVLLTATDTNGCTKIADMYVLDQPAPSCAIKDVVLSPVTIGKDFVTMKLENISNDKLTLKKVIMRYDHLTKPSAKALNSVVFNGTSVSNVCSTSTTVTTAPANQIIDANSSNYTIQFNFTIGNLQGNNPIASLCLVYQTPQGDLLQCRVIPNAATCTDPGGNACQ
jgi:prepilin-type N-terminal cleavage/methylation domain-containing protein